MILFTFVATMITLKILRTIIIVIIMIDILTIKLSKTKSIFIIKISVMVIILTIKKQLIDSISNKCKHINSKDDN